MKAYRKRSSNILTLGSVGFVGLLSEVNIAANKISERPNILFICIDDQSHRTLSCYKDFRKRLRKEIERTQGEFAGTLPSREHFNSQGNHLVNTIN